MAGVREEKRQKMEDCDSKVGQKDEDSDSKVGQKHEEKDDTSSSEEEKVVNEDEYTLVLRREMTAEEYAKYKKQVRASKGFDVERFPAMLPGGIVPRDVNGHGRDVMINLSKQALDHYNGGNNAAYEFVELVKATSQCVEGRMYYITFRAKDTTDTCQTFRTKVWEKLFDETPEVLTCDMIQV